MKYWKRYLFMSNNVAFSFIYFSEQLSFFRSKILPMQKNCNIRTYNTLFWKLLLLPFFYREADWIDKISYNVCKFYIYITPVKNHSNVFKVIKCMSTTVHVNLTLQFTFFLNMRLNITIVMSCDSLIVILVTQFFHH